MDKFPKRKSNRLKNYDYATPGYYFITACCENKLELFGAVINDKMLLNGAGKMVEQTLLEIPDFYRGFSLDTCIIMPNHIHVIIVIQNNKLLINGQAQGPVPTKLSLSDIIHRFKTISTKKYIDGVKNKGWPPFSKKIWQRSFHDHIIRNERSLKKIREYIINNPENWNTDEHNIKNHKVTVQACLNPTE